MNASGEAEAGEEERVQRYPSPEGETQQPGPYYGHDEHEAPAPPRESEQQDPAAAQHQPSHAASVEELQLAAQLGQDLAAEPMMPVTDPNMKFDEPPLRNIMPHPEEHQLRLSQGEDHNLRHVHVMPPHPDDSQARPYDEAVPGSPATAAVAVAAAAAAAAPQPQNQVPPMNPSLSHSFPTVGNDPTPPRKRSKVSRACDECRRKKVRCDAQSDRGDAPCSNCKRSSQPCSFSRIPQKRGPSKGYIKELADRINSIEGRLGEGASDDVLRKRAFSSISGNDMPTHSAPPRQASPAWASDGRPITTLTPERNQVHYSLNNLAPQPIALKPDLPSRPPVANMDGDMSMSGISGVTQPRDVPDDIFQGYLSVIHPYLPILPANKARLQASLAQCSGLLREAFLEALSGTIHCFPSTSAAATGDASLAMKILAEWESQDGEPRTSSAHIIHLQTLLLLLIEMDTRPSACSGPLKESLLGRAVGAALAMKLYNARVDRPLEGESEPNPDPDPDSDSDSDSESHLRVKLWWSLVLLDRWHAVAAGTQTMIRNESTVVYHGLESIVDEMTFLMIRASKILSQVSTVISSLQDPMSGGSVPARILGDFLNDYVENFREDLPQHIDHGPASYQVIYLTYWHARLVAYLLHPSSNGNDILWPCREIVRLLGETPQPTSPWNHHIAGLALLALMELSRVEGTKEKANKLLAELKMKSLPAVPSAWDSIIGDRIAEHLGQAGGSQGLLQQLADVAASSSAAAPHPEKMEGLSGGYRTATNYEDLGFDPRPLLTEGYLKTVWASYVQT
ncbi:hypothetical protein SODALDRAFT_355540 [Sodiomyces alkalinus F11]|uniref:Zn(2)-C6 fungal-type domain-containing protein n=1 Tax=Sodiomyces alkalinus (strain CBS 110278 / VKM F-3762 / F11) TaxID=1314773 RepID=A0A3N2Q983_SODAK|nr:hypothetical protein SODALDRAFT_355540 [Sodiomyces alkalinus F11]ROT43333.1 hypothetical protein SODALDRAFT_355540 [Sodiomyces alkalinus F11]